MLDLSTKADLRFLADLAGTFRGAAHDVPFFLAGATARDLLLEYAHGINPGRDTRDVDLAMVLPDWGTFEVLRARLIATGHFSQRGIALHQLMFEGFLEVDLIPFGGIEQPDRTLAWPPDGDFVMKVFGFREAYEATLPVLLPNGEVIRVVSLPALALLKLMAWCERRLTSPGKDAHDLAAVLRNYLDAGNHERLYIEASHLLAGADFDYELSGAWLLGYDMARLLPTVERPTVARILHTESDINSNTLLAGDMPIETVRALALLQSMAKGFLEAPD